MTESVQKAAAQILQYARGHMTREVQRLYVDDKNLDKEKQIILRGVICHVLNQNNCLDIVYKTEKEATVQVKISTELDGAIRQVIDEWLNKYDDIKKGRFQNLIT